MQYLFFEMIVILLICSNVDAEYFSIKPGNLTDSVSFESTAKLEFIEGKSHDIVGSFEIDLQQTEKSVRGIFRVDLKTLKTGIDLRDEHMRNNHLNTDVFPYAFFEFLEVSNLPEILKEKNIYKATISGFFYIHGCKKRIEPEIEIIYEKVNDNSNNIKVSASFPINLEEFNIPRPKALFFKLAEKIKVSVMFSAQTSARYNIISLPEWSECQ